MLWFPRSGRDRYVVSDLQPGDVLRANDGSAVTVHSVTPVHDDPEKRTVAFDPVGDRSVVWPAGAPVFRLLVATNADPHYPVCSQCREVWPCIHVQAEDATSRALQDARYECDHCGRSTLGCKTVTVPVVTDRGVAKELLFHGRRGPCLTAARKLDPTAKADW